MSLLGCSAYVGCKSGTLPAVNGTLQFATWPRLSRNLIDVGQWEKTKICLCSISGACLIWSKICSIFWIFFGHFSKYSLISSRYLMPFMSQVWVLFCLSHCCIWWFEMNRGVTIHSVMIWFVRVMLGAQRQQTSHYLNQRWPSSLMHASLGLPELTQIGLKQTHCKYFLV